MPKKREVDLELPGVTPEEAAERLKASTKPALFPSFSNPFRGRGEEPLVGRVAEDGFVVSPNESGYNRVVPTGSGSIEATDTGARIRATVGIPALMVWGLRFGYIAALAGVSSAAYTVLTSGESAMLMSVFAGFVVLATAATGWNVHQAEAKIPKLAADLENALLSREPEATETMEVDLDEDERKRRLARRAKEVER